MSEPPTCLRPEALAAIDRLELRARLVVEGFVSGRHRSPWHGGSVEFAAHRAYAPGDDLRRIDWRLFARGDRLHIKQFEEQTNLRTLVLLDGSGSMAYASPQAGAAARLSKYDYAATIAASLAWLLLMHQDACGVTVFGGGPGGHIPPTSRRDRLNETIATIERHRPAGVGDLDQVIAGLGDHLRRRGLVVLISDLLGQGEQLNRTLRTLRAHGQDVIVLQVLDADELSFPFDDQVRFEGLEAPGFVQSDAQSLRAAYLAAIRRFLAECQAACAGLGVDYRLMSTAEPPGAALAGFLAARMRHLGRGGGPR